MNKREEGKNGESLGPKDKARASILSAALHLLNAGGRDAVTTRAVAEAAGVKPPILYRHFGDKDGLLNALAEHGFGLYLAQKQSHTPHQNPIEALRSGWDKHVHFGLEHSSLYLLMYAQPPRGPAPAAELSSAMLHRHMGRVAAAGLLRIPEERAVALFHAAAVGIVITLLRKEQHGRDMELSSMARDNTLSMIARTRDDPANSSPVSLAATTLAAAITMQDGFSHGEFTLFQEWLGRMKGA